jgi:hypothetical protein
MPNLGKKFECFNCRTKFYDLGKPEAVCPKCGSNQKDAKEGEEAAPPAPRVRRPPPIVVPSEAASDFEEAASDDEDEAAEPAGYGEEEFEDEEPPLETHARESDEEF